MCVCVCVWGGGGVWMRYEVLLPVALKCLELQEYEVTLDSLFFFFFFETCML